MTPKPTDCGVPKASCCCRRGGGTKGRERSITATRQELRLSILPAETGVLSRQSTTRTFGHASGRRRDDDGFPTKDGQRGSTTTISASRADRRVLPRVD